MFSKKKSPVKLTKLSSLVASSMEVRGDVIFSDGLRIDGHVKGNVNPASDAMNLLVLSEVGSIHGNVCAYDAIINGTIVGDLEVLHFLELQENARITGNIRYRQIRMNCGASVDGKLSTLEDQADITNVVELAANQAAK